MVGVGAEDGFSVGVIVFVLSSGEILLSEDSSGTSVGSGTEVWSADGVKVISVLSAGSEGFPHETVETASSPAQASALICREQRGNFLLCTMFKLVVRLFFLIDKLLSIWQAVLPFFKGGRCL